MGKTAVIVIHGVGEHRPMGTVSGFTRLLAGNYFRSKPDPDSSFLELRRLSTFVDDPARIDAKLVQDAKDHVTGYPPSTVFYEFYWAFHYRDTKPGLVIQWSLSTVWKLFRSGQLRMVRRPVLHIIAALIAAVVAFFVAIFLICLGISRLIRPDRNWLVGAASIAGGTVLPFIFNTFFKPFLVSWAGDAARYFGASPDNPIERQQIRKEGIDLLRRLHLPDKNNRTYDDIVIVGHSLGSVIAYDIIMNYWIEVHRQIQIEENNHVLMAIENLPGANAPTTATAWDIPSTAPTEKYQRMQEELVQSLGNTLNKSGAKIREVW